MNEQRVLLLLGGGTRADTWGMVARWVIGLSFTPPRVLFNPSPADTMGLLHNLGDGCRGQNRGRDGRGTATGGPR